MKLIIGLGNPDKKYQFNRHNAGHLFIESLSSSTSLSSCKLLKTNVFMNESGRFVKKLATDYELRTTNLYIVHDDLDLKLGTYKIQFGTGPKIHYGLQSIEKELGTKDFWRVRLGVDNRDPNNRALGEEYVLENFTLEEREVLVRIFPKVWEDLISRLASQ